LPSWSTPDRRHALCCTACVSICAGVVRTMATVPEIKRVGVLGLGLMGHGIVQTAAAAGYAVTGVDADDAAVKRGVDAITKSVQALSSKAVAKKTLTEDAAKAQVAETLGRIKTATSRDALAECDLIIEAVPETMEVKTPVYQVRGGQRRVCGMSGVS